MIIIGLLFSLLVVSDGRVCRALALSGGADYGAYQAGALNRITNKIDPIERQWDVITGVSAGALNTASVLLFKKGEEVAWSDYLLSIWMKIKKNKVYKKWRPFGYLQGLLRETGIYSTQPLKEFIKTEVLSKKIYNDRNIVITATNMDKGVITSWTEGLSVDDLVKVTLASSAYPGVFPTQVINSTTYSDGGILENVNVQGAINRCLDGIAESEDEIILDVITCAPPRHAIESQSHTHPIGILIRTANLLFFRNSVDTLREAIRLHPSVKFRYLVIPSQPLVGGRLDFSHDAILENIERGKADAEYEVDNTTPVNGGDLTWSPQQSRFIRVFNAVDKYVNERTMDERVTIPPSGLSHPIHTKQQQPIPHWVNEIPHTLSTHTEDNKLGHSVGSEVYMGDLAVGTPVNVDTIEEIEITFSKYMPHTVDEIFLDIPHTQDTDTHTQDTDTHTQGTKHAEDIAHTTDTPHTTYTYIPREETNTVYV
eukprot:GHVR01044311.1.p1 GENE.GHVR01044311.1~~GHVR01044311.1.p1  ORF type:complete len:497 (+),score=132.05 GHVR01044311.1:45-1493(+)